MSRSGSRRILDIVDAMTQKGINMTMKEWAHYFENPDSRDRTLNVISLEFSHTKLQNYVEQPTIVSIRCLYKTPTLARVPACNL